MLMERSNVADAVTSEPGDDPPHNERGGLGESADADGIDAAAGLEAMVQEARALYRNDDLDAAQAVAGRVLALDPTNETALRIAARFHVRNGDNDLAEGFWRTLSDVAADKVEPALQVARAARHRGDWREQARFADLVVAQDPDHQEALWLAVNGRLHSQELDDLPRLVPRLYRADHDRVLAFLHGLRTPERSAILASVIANLLAVDKDDPRLARFAEECVEFWLQGARRIGTTQGDEGLGRRLRAVLTVAPNSTEAIEGLERLSRNDLVQMRAALRSGDKIGARRFAQRAVEIDPALHEAWQVLARSWLDDDPIAAIAAFQRCVALNGDDPTPHIGLARAYEKAGRLAEAIATQQDIERLVADESDPRHVAATAALAGLRRKAVAQARELYGEAALEEAWRLCALAAQSPDCRRQAGELSKQIMRAMFVSARTSYKDRQSGFLEAAQRYLERDPDNREMLTYFAAALMEARAFEPALAIWRKLAGVDPANVPYQIRIARCCLALKRVDEGTQASAKALELDPESAMAQEVASALRLASLARQDRPPTA